MLIGDKERKQELRVQQIHVQRHGRWAHTTKMRRESTWELATEVLSHLQIAAVGDKEDSNYVTGNRCCPVGTLGLWPSTSTGERDLATGRKGHAVHA
jgi:hypothetical protein